MNRWILAAAVLSLAGCASEPPGQPPPRDGASPPPASRPGADQCGASELQYLVGRPRTEIPVPVNPDLRRVACTTCPVTLDYNPRRLNIFYDADTGVIKEVRCG